MISRWSLPLLFAPSIPFPPRTPGICFQLLATWRLTEGSTTGGVYVTTPPRRFRPFKGCEQGLVIPLSWMLGTFILQKVLSWPTVFQRGSTRVALQLHMIIVFLSFQIQSFHQIKFFLGERLYSIHQSKIGMREHVDTVACRVK